MRPSLLIAALAVGAVNALEKRVYVTDWTTTTVYNTVTEGAAENQHPTQQAQPAQTVYTTTTVAPPPETTSSDQNKDIAPVAPQPTTTQGPAPGPESQSQNQAPVHNKQNQAPAHNQQNPPPVPTQGQPQNQQNPPPAPAPTQHQAQPKPQTTSYYTTKWTSTVDRDPTSTLSTATADPTAPPMNAYQQAVLYNHNIHRSNHSAPSVDWSSELEESARKLANGCVYEHNTSIDGGGYGQNIGYGVKEHEVGILITNLMYNDEIGYFPKPYGAASPPMNQFDYWGHFSQIVWKGTTHVGCATVMCHGLGNVDSSSSLPFTVCNYSPPGNYAGEYGSNVLPPQGQSMYNA